MPRGDRTGPTGAGPKTGRQMGYCTGHESPGFVNMYAGWRRGPGRGPGRGWGRGPGAGYGYGRGFGSRFAYGYGPAYEEIPDVSEKTLVENEIRILKDQLAKLEDRLSRLAEG
jgi:hypothetical protein